MPSVLFVCLGNICRSPTAEAVFRHKSALAGLNVTIDSAGTSAAHRGEAPDNRSMRTGERRGYDFSGQYSRQVTSDDFFAFDYILAMDSHNLQNLKRFQPKDAQSSDSQPSGNQAHVSLFLDFIKPSEKPVFPELDVPDPYYGGAEGFDRVLDLIEVASEGLIHHITVKDEIG